MTVRNALIHTRGGEPCILESRFLIDFVVKSKRGGHLGPHDFHDGVVDPLILPHRH